MNANIIYRERKVIINTLIFTLLVSLIPFIVCSFMCAVWYCFGTAIGLINYLLRVYMMEKYLGEKHFKIMLNMLLRITVIVLIITPIRNDPLLIGSYCLGLISHYIILFYSVIYKKGSA